ncbi:OLC1v1021833C1 [Oldenlandia corymbosa var. corymbosa]|uniref:OLC1v1021833C1 n=1 Tax=Oldenlandia corymbosa var. corymbosa TaxID=529605 RepID=A0AAV1BWJ2_OLDCO|nr:OLC1v1021833C1 [Oldenlandia corymbosa var. corymbosa]
MVNSLKSKCTSAMNSIEELLKQKPELKQPLTECWAKYDASIMSVAILDAIEAATNGDAGLGEESMDVVTTSAHQCDDGFKPSPSPLVDANRIVCDVAAVVEGMFTVMR